MTNAHHSFDRRALLKLASLGAAAYVTSSALAAGAATRLVLVHGRSQQGRNPNDLKAEWLESLRLGAQKSGLEMPNTINVAFPYYGDLLDEFARQYNVPLTSDVNRRGSQEDDEFLAFQAQVAESVLLGSGVTDSQVDAEYGPNPRPKGPLNWEWVQAVLRAVDKHGGGMSQSSLEIFTRDVFLYTTRAGIRDEIDRIVGAALNEEPTIVVGHSLGSVVAYNVLRSDRRSLRIPLYLTVGCPLGIRAIRDQLRPLRHPTPVKAWYNAFDPRDVVALFPLDRANFPVTPEIENYSQVRNRTDNRHGIVGYLDDATVAKQLIDGLKN